MRPDQTQGTSAPQEFPAAGELVVDGHRWFDLDLTPRPHPTQAGASIVASVAIDLAAEGLLIPRQLADNPDPVTRLCLTRSAGGRLDRITWGDCEAHVPYARVLRAIGQAALAAGTVTAAQWSAFADAEGLT